MSPREVMRGKLERFREEWNREGLDRRTRMLRVAELALVTLRIAPAITVIHERFYELTKPPAQFRGLRDLKVRLAGAADRDALTGLDSTREQIAARLGRGDLVYVAESEGRMFGQCWFHRGPEPFDEDAGLLSRWAMANDTFWSYGAYALPEARLSGVFVKLFQSSLRDLLTVHGAARVQCRVKAANVRSVALHERTGFRLLGEMTALALPGAHLLSWEGDGGPRRWVQRRGGDGVLALPPIPQA